MKSRLAFIVLGFFAHWQAATGLQAQINPEAGLDAPGLVWTTGGTGGAGWTYEPQSSLGGDNTFDGLHSAKTGACGDNGESWIQTEVFGPGTVSFWWQVYCEYDADWLEFYIGEQQQDGISGGDTGSWWLGGWQYRSFTVPEGRQILKWRYKKDGSLTGGSGDCGWLDRVSYVATLTTPLPTLEQALDTTGLEWNTAGTLYANGWTAQESFAHDGSLAAQSGEVWHNQNNWLQTTVSGATSVDFWWKVSSESFDYLEFYINDVLVGRISGETEWQHAYFSLPAGPSCVLKWMYRKDDSITAGANCGWLDQISFNNIDSRVDTSTSVSGPGRATVYGQPATFTATVAAAQGTSRPTGMVSFKDGSTILGTAPISAGSATLSTTALATGSHSITAVYHGDAGSSESTSPAISQTVNAASTATVLSSSAKSSVFGQTLTFTVTVSPVAPATETPGGTVTFKDGKTSLATVPLTDGQAILTTTALGVASHTILAVFNGNADFLTSSSSVLKLTVAKAASSIAVVSSANPSVSGQSVTFTATVSPSAPSVGTPTGTVQFKLNGANLGAAVALSGGTASSAPVTSLTAGSTASVTAVYSGDAGYNSSTSPALSQTVLKATTSTELTSSANSPVFGQPVMFTAKVAAAGGGTPTGSVTFKDGATTLATVTLTGGQGSFTSSALVVGTHMVTAVYAGNTGYSGSQTDSPTEVLVQKADTTTTLSSSARESAVGQAVTFTAMVNAVAPGAGVCSGTVQFAADGVALGGPVNLSGGKATSSPISSLAKGSHNITATYSGDANFVSSANTASPLIQAVKTFASTITLASSKNPAVVGDRVAWTATVSAPSPAEGTPGGTVQFMVDGANFAGPVTLAGGTCASQIMATLSAGSHTITAVYSGDTDFVSVTSAGLTQTVNSSPVTPATGGEAITADTAGKAWTTLTGPVYTESQIGAVGVGTIILNAPVGFEFDTAGSAPAVKITGGSTSSYNINDAANGSVLPVTGVSPSQLTFTVTAASSGKRNANKLTWQNIRVRPTATTPLASGVMTKTGTATMAGVTTTTGFGYLAEIAGAATGLTQGLQSNDDGALNSAIHSTSMPVVITSLVRQADGSMMLRAQGVPGRAYLIQACETLGSWSSIASKAADANGLIVFLDQEAPNYSSRFYRLAAD